MQRNRSQPTTQRIIQCICVVQVCHHPTIIAACSEGRRWKLEGDAELKSKFWGRSIELHPHGVLRLTFNDGDEYMWSKVFTPACCLAS